MAASKEKTLTPSEAAALCFERSAAIEQSTYFLLWDGEMEVDVYHTTFGGEGADGNSSLVMIIMPVYSGLEVRTFGTDRVVVRNTFHPDRVEIGKNNAQAREWLIKQFEDLRSGKNENADQTCDITHSDIKK